LVKSGRLGPQEDFTGVDPLRLLHLPLHILARQTWTNIENAKFELEGVFGVNRRLHYCHFVIRRSHVKS